MENKKITDVKVFNKDGQIYVSYTINSIKGKFFKEEPLYDNNGNINMHAQNILEIAQKLEKKSSNNKTELTKHETIKTNMEKNSNDHRLTKYNSLQEYESSNNNRKKECVRKSNDNRLTVYSSMRKHKNNSLNIYQSKNNSLTKFDTKPSTNVDYNFDLSGVFVARPYMISDPDDLSNLSYTNEFFLIKPIYKKNVLLGKDEIIGYTEVITQRQIIKKIKLKRTFPWNEYEPPFYRVTRYVNANAYYEKSMYWDDFLEKNLGNVVWEICDKLPARSFLTKQEICAYFSLNPEEMNRKLMNLQYQSYQECSDSYKHYVLTNKFKEYDNVKSFYCDF